jgi:hypothetical protein
MTKLIPIVVKKSRLHNTFKYWGGILNPEQKYYTRRVTSKTNPINQLRTIVNDEVLRP